MGGRSENALTLVLLAAAVAIGAYLRFDGLGEPSYWLDEILHQQLTTTFAAKPWWQWLGRLDEENAGLYYLTQLATRAFGTSEFAGRLAAALFGVATITLLSGARQQPFSSAIAAILLATSPLHVYYSREARGYALLMFLTAALIVILLRARSLVAAALVLLAMVYTSAIAIPIVVTAAIVCFLLALLTRERWYALTGAAALVALALFRLIYAPRLTHDAALATVPPFDLSFFTKLARMFSVTALGGDAGGRTAVAMLVFAVIGAIVLARKDRRQAIVIIGMTLLPLAMTLAAVQVFRHFFAVRYVAASLVGYVLLAAIGIAFIAQLIARKAAPILAVAIVIVIAAQGWSAARTEPFQKLDWRAIAATLRDHVRPGDVILTAEHWSEVSLRHYLGEIPNVRFAYMAGTGIAEIILYQHHSAWLVTAGFSADPSVRNWMCRYPLVLASPLEDFRLHYAPSRGDFLQIRSRPPEQRAVSAALGDRGFTIRMEDDVLFGSGWAGVEGIGDEVFRWVVGRRATLVLPTRERHDRTIRFRAYPHLPQTMRVSLNGHALAAIPLARAWSDYSLVAPASVWNDGLNTLAFEFEKAAAPSATDRRALAASFARISLDDESRSARIPSIRIDADTFLDANSAWRNTITHFPPAQLRRETVEPLLGRLGFDPIAGWQKLTRGEVRLENLAETIAYGSDCEDDRTFLRRAFAILVERAPNELEERDLLRRMREGTTRVQVMGRIVKADDFRRGVTVHSTSK